MYPADNTRAGRAIADIGNRAVAGQVATSRSIRAIRLRDELILTATTASC